MGVPGVMVLAGGLPAWSAAGGDVEQGAEAALPWGWERARRAARIVAPGPLGDAVVLSVDASDAYARGHVPGAAWICRSRLEEKVGAVAPDRNRPIVVTCADGRASTLAAETLRGMGYSDVGVLDGGLAAWRRAGQPVETGPTRVADDTDDVVLKPYERGRAAMEAYLTWEKYLDDRGRSPHALLP
jgi:rhodanese-related sulfurtransferase